MAVTEKTSMKKDSVRILKVLFFITAAGNLISHISSAVWLEYATKPLLMILLILIFTTSSIDQKSISFRLTILALLFSWFGDILLLFQSWNELFFLLGLFAFLIAQIFYIFVYRKICLPVRPDKKSRVFINVRIIFLILIGFALYSILFNHIGNLRIPVAVYTIAIISMAIAAVLRKGRTSEQSFLMVYMGALLFIMSDSMIAINQFLEPIIYARLLIMLTYILAQYLIVQGILKHEKDMFKYDDGSD